MDTQVPDNLPELPSEPPREALIATAIKFLQNPKVLDSSLDKKKNFLTGKGLTSEEIEIAISRAGIVNVISATTGSSGINGVVGVPPTQTVKEISTWDRLKEYSMITILLGGVVYGCYYVFKNFIQPLFTKHAQEQEQRMDCLESGINNISTGIARDMQEIQSSLSDIRQHLEENSTKLNYLSSDGKMTVSSYNSDATSTAVSELKSEISSIKGLLLSRRQFPATPNNPPVIPSWQQLKPALNSDADTENTPAKTEIDLTLTNGLHKDDQAVNIVNNKLTNGHTESENGNSEDTLPINGVGDCQDKLTKPILEINTHMAIETSLTGN